MKKICLILSLVLLCSSVGFIADSTSADGISIDSVRKQCSTSKKAKKQMTKITFKTWALNGNKKVTKVRSIYINKKIAKQTKKALTEIYNGKEKFPIHDIGGFQWRGSTKSLHSLGLAVDINSNENYMIDGKKILCGSFWKPGKNPYSIPKNGDVMKAFRRNGLKQCIWGSRKDYMHFSVKGY